MTKAFNKSLMLSACIMIALPIIVALIFSLPATSGWGFIITLFLFFVLNPLFTIFLGIFCSKNIKKYMLNPLLNSIFFIIGVWTAFDFGNLDFTVYAVVYFCIGYAAMLVNYFIKRIKNK